MSADTEVSGGGGGSVCAHDLDGAYLPLRGCGWKVFCFALYRTADVSLYLYPFLGLGIVIFLPLVGFPSSEEVWLKEDREGTQAGWSFGNSDRRLPGPSVGP